MINQLCLPGKHVLFWAAAPAEAEAASWFISCAEALPIARNEGGDRSALFPLTIPSSGEVFLRKLFMLQKIIYNISAH